MRCNTSLSFIFKQPHKSILTNFRQLLIKLTIPEMKSCINNNNPNTVSHFHLKLYDNL